MALTVEDGTGLAAADSYLSVAAADAYHAAFGNADWAALGTPDKETALRRATQYIDSAYRFDGNRLTDTQALEWPRDLGHEWPLKRLSDATAELALKASSGALFSDVESGDVTRETVGPITVEYGSNSLGGQTRYAAVDALLAPLTLGNTLGGFGSNRIVRTA